MRWLCVLALAGCHYGAGPVIAYADHGLRLGAELSGGAAVLRGSTGVTIAPAHGDFRFYAAFEPGFAGPVDDKIYPGAGATVGIASSADDVGLAAGAWASTSYVRSCNGSDGRYMTSIALGVRWLAGIEEVYLTPKVGWAECVSIGH